MIDTTHIWLRAHRTLSLPAGRARTELVRLLGQHQFKVTTDQLTLIEAERGSQMGGATRNADAIPLRMRIHLQADEFGSTVWYEIRDDWKVMVGRPTGTYQEVFSEVSSAIDKTLRRLDPEGPAFAPPERSVTGPAGPDSPGAGLAARAFQAADRFLDGSGSEQPAGWRQRGTFIIAVGDLAARIDTDQVYGMVTAGNIVASRPGGMPRGLVGQVEQVTSLLERNLQAVSGSDTTVLNLEVTAVPVIEFLVQQARLREQLPLRTLQVCVTCRLSKIVNPDYQRLKKRAQRKRVLGSSLGAMISTHGISPFVLVGRFSQMKQLDPDFVCPRCQGLHAETSLVTFCPSCGKQYDESALRVCAHCGHDFRKIVSTIALWQPKATLAIGPASPRAVTPTASAPPATFADSGAPAATYAGSPFGGHDSSGVAGGRDAAATAAGYDAAAAPAAYATQSSFACEEGAAPDVVFVTPQQRTDAAASGGDEIRARLKGSSILPAPGWYPDPSTNHEYRWWDGTVWTPHVANGGVVSRDG